LYLGATLLILLVRRTRPLTSFALKQAINSLHRPGNQTRIIVMIVGLGVFAVLSVQSLQANFINELDRGRTGDLPDMFLIDIQTDQRQGVSDIVAETMGSPPILVPTVRTRIVAIDGKDIDLNDTEMKRERGRLGRNTW
jgi:putative ABC transport system permease protein